MTDKTYKDIAVKDQALVRKALDGSVFLAPSSATAITALTADSTGDPGVPTLAALPAGYIDLGFLSDAGAVISEAVSTADITAWGEVEPVRRDITSDVTSVHLVGLETKLTSFAAFFGVDPATITPDATTGEVSVPRPDRPVTRYYRMLVLAVDQTDDGELYVARFLPRVALSDKGDQTFASADTGITWDSTWTAFTDSTLGYADRFIGAGAGWQSLLTPMGFS